jgi:hypothetical protein
VNIIENKKYKYYNVFYLIMFNFILLMNAIYYYISINNYIKIFYFEFNEQKVNKKIVKLIENNRNLFIVFSFMSIILPTINQLIYILFTNKIFDIINITLIIIFCVSCIFMIISIINIIYYNKNIYKKTIRYQDLLNFDDDKISTLNDNSHDDFDKNFEIVSFKSELDVAL